jgi:hypothetical protein
MVAAAAKLVSSAAVACAGPYVETCASTEFQYHKKHLTPDNPNPYPATCEGSADAVGSSAAGSPATTEVSPLVGAAAGTVSSPAQVGAGVTKWPSPASDGGAGSPQSPPSHLTPRAVSYPSPRGLRPPHHAPSTKIAYSFNKNHTNTHIYPHTQSQIYTYTTYLIHRPIGPLPDSLTSVRAPHPIVKRPGRPLQHRVLNLEDFALEVLVRSVEDFEVPTSLVGQGIHGPFASDERGEGHEWR